MEPFLFLSGIILFALSLGAMPAILFAYFFMAEKITGSGDCWWDDEDRCE